jgi:2'-5' RNA ligase
MKPALADDKPPGSSLLMRTFLAIDVPDRLRPALSAVQHRDAADRGRLRWMAPSTFHITMRFLGATAEEQVAPVAEALAAKLATFAPFSLTLSGGGAFPSAQKPRVLWAGIRGDVEALTAIAAALEEVVREAGFPPDEKRFHPHVTIGRVQDGRPRGTAARLEQIGDLGSFDVDEVIWFRSDSGPNCMIYTPIRRLRIGADRG